jgi:hypothetical protein
MTIDTGTAVPVTLQMASGEVLLILKEALMTLTQGQHLLTAWIFVPNITDEFVLGLDVLCFQNATFDLKRIVL